MDIHVARDVEDQLTVVAVGREVQWVLQVQQARPGLWGLWDSQD